MSYGELGYNYRSAARAQASERAIFIRRTYAHLAGAVLAFAAIEFLIFNLVPRETLDSILLQYFRTQFSWLIVVGAFLVCGYVARWWAYSGAAPALQYAGLALYVGVEALIFVPLLWIVMHTMGPLQAAHLLTEAGVLTLCLFARLTATVFI